MERYVCIHGHFYQPPRENPWLEAIEIQDSAYPYHDWNERVSAECYGPNATSRLLNDHGQIRAIANNYSRISFDFGPTLLSWMYDSTPEVYQAVLQADLESQKAFGHGSAMAQAYNHIILPLANTRDKRTEIVWGLVDFRWRFGRDAEGMWLPETAVDLESLLIMAEQGIKFVILSPHQARQIRPLGGGDQEWEDVGGARIDPSRAYLCRPGGDATIAVFFYDGPTSQALAFENLLANGQTLADRLIAALSDARDWPQLEHIATDGESYGHHFHNGDMALAYALEAIAAGESASLLTYSSFLAANPPTHEVEIVENTSWSCPHGVERWRSDCGCNTGMHPGWNQAWRAPLRESMDWLRDALASRFEEGAAQLVIDPWSARDDYIGIILDRSEEKLQKFLETHSSRALDDREQSRLLRLLELQRHCLLMFTSCGWFFDEISGLESVQVIQYAGRALQLAHDLFDIDLEPEFVARLEAAKSNLPENRDGRLVYDKFVKPAALDLTKVGAHYAVSSLFDGEMKDNRIYSYRVDEREEERLEAGALRLQLGHVRLTSVVTLEQEGLSFAALHFGDQNVICKVKEYDEPAHSSALTRLKDSFRSAELAPILAALDESYGDTSYTLSSLFRDQQRKILGSITRAALDEAEAMYRQVYGHHAALLMFLKGIGAPTPEAFTSAAQLVLNADLRKSLEEDRINPQAIESMLEAAARTGVSLDGPGLGFAFQHTLERLADELLAKPGNRESLAALLAAAGLVRKLPFAVNLWGAQNRYYRALHDVVPTVRGVAGQDDRVAAEWMGDFLTIGDLLSVEHPPNEV
jgi:alpha-amylase/alpha-mannosidase (GH57 family)